MRRAPQDLADFLAALAADCEGATAIEYGLIVAIASLAAVSAMQYFGESVSQSFQKPADAIQQAIP